LLKKTVETRPLGVVVIDPARTVVALTERRVIPFARCFNASVPQMRHHTRSRTFGEPGSGGSIHLAILEFLNVSKDYTTEGLSVPALHDVTLSIQAGEFVALVGRSGCGKSTLLNLAGAMDFPTTGQVLVDGAVTSTLDDAGLTRLRRSKVGFIFQSFQLLNTLSVVENVELPLMLSGLGPARAKAMDCLRLTGMEEFSRRMPYQLSGGQMQRVGIARALVHEPVVLLADEPTGNLDTATGDSILDLLRSIADAGKSAVVMATHSLEGAARANRTVRLRDGRVAEVTAGPSRSQLRFEGES
jgi:putative ABC transport system ATP-binding protein